MHTLLQSSGKIAFVILIFLMGIENDGLAQINTTASVDILTGNFTEKMFKGNKFELIIPRVDTVTIEDPETRELQVKITRLDSLPVKMNGMAIADRTIIENLALPAKGLNEYFIEIVQQNKKLFNKLNDGRYSLNPRHFVINENGKVVYYKFTGLEDVGYVSRNIDGNILSSIGENKELQDTKENEAIKAEINKLIISFIESNKIKFSPAEKEGKKIISMANDPYVLVIVNSHIATAE